MNRIHFGSLEESERKKGSQANLTERINEVQGVSLEELERKEPSTEGLSEYTKMVQNTPNKATRKINSSSNR